MKSIEYIFSIWKSKEEMDAVNYIELLLSTAIHEFHSIILNINCTTFNNTLKDEDI